MKWYENFETFLDLFTQRKGPIDETIFRFRGESPMDAHYIGYLPRYDKPYWAGYCDLPDGCEFSTADELFHAKIYDGKSIFDRWDEIIIEEIGGIPIENYSEDVLRT